MMESTACTGPLSSSQIALYTSLCLCTAFLPVKASLMHSTWIYGNNSDVSGKVLYSYDSMNYM